MTPAIADNATGWRKETLQLRKNNEERRAQMADFVKLFDQLLQGVKPNTATLEQSLCCLALHHLAMACGSYGGPRARKIMHGAKLKDLPKSYGFEGRLGREI